MIVCIALTAFQNCSAIYHHKGSLYQTSPALFGSRPNVQLTADGGTRRTGQMYRDDFVLVIAAWGDCNDSGVGRVEARANVPTFDCLRVLILSGRF